MAAETHREYVEPYQFFDVQPDHLKMMTDYISVLKESDYKHEEYEFQDDFIDEYFEKYRCVEIHIPSYKSVFNIVGARVFNDINERHFKYDLAPNAFEFQLLKYHEGGNYNWHCDYGVTPYDNMTRKLSISINLSKAEDYVGGDLDMIDYGNRCIKLDHTLGSGVVFDARTPHRANPVDSGVRDVLVGWASGPRFR